MKPTTNGENGDRQSNGRFSKGNAGGPGNPHFRKVAGLRSAMLNAITDEDIGLIIKRMIEAAKEGDLNAAKLILSYAIGRPDNPINPDRVELNDRSISQDIAISNLSPW